MHLRTLPLIAAAFAGAVFAQQSQDPDYAKLVKEWTTRPEFMTPLVDHLPKAAGVPSPKDVLGYYVGAPKKLTHVADLLRYYRALAAASKRVKILPAGQTDEGREQAVVVIADEEAIRNLDSFRGDAALFTWLCTICRHEIASVRRKQGRQPVHESIDTGGLARDFLIELPAPAESEPPQELELASQRNAVARTMNRLPERYARVLEWKYGDGFSVEEIAGMLGLTVIAVQSLLARARKEFKDLWVREHTS